MEYNIIISKQMFIFRTKKEMKVRYGTGGLVCKDIICLWGTVTEKIKSSVLGAKKFDKGGWICKRRQL